MTRQLASGAKDLGGGGARFAGSPLYVQDIACDDLRTLRCLLHVTGDPARRGAGGERAMLGTIPSTRSASSPLASSRPSVRR